jgi:hypothetical protein
LLIINNYTFSGALKEEKSEGGAEIVAGVVTENLEAEVGAVAETGAAAETGVEIVTGVGTEVAVETGDVGIKGTVWYCYQCYQYPVLWIRIRSDRHLLAGYGFGPGSRACRFGSGPQTGSNSLRYFDLKYL